MTFSFSELLASAPITPDLTAAGAEEAIRAVAGLLKGQPAIADADRLITQLLEREKLTTTAMGHGVAIPHARTDAVREIVMAIGRSKTGVLFQGADGPVHFVFVIGTPPDRVTQYLAVVGRLARLLKNESIRAQLLQAASAEDLRTALHAE